VAGTTYYDTLRATLTGKDPKEFLFFNVRSGPTDAFSPRLGVAAADRRWHGRAHGMGQTRVEFLLRTPPAASEVAS
jgi:hypothetical protein